MNKPRHQAVAVIAALALVLAWLVLDQRGGPNPIRDGLSYALAPIQFALTRAVRPLATITSYVGRLSQLERDHASLRQENATLRSQITLLQEAAIENARLRQQLRFQSSVPSFELLSAEVIGRDPNNLLAYLIIDRGAADGIKTGMPVLAPQGLVGRVGQVSAASAKVMLITDASSSVSALIQRTRSTGVVQGFAGRELRMRYMPQGEVVEPGDVVLSAGLGGNFPRRLVIGQVASVDKQDVAMFQEARVIPAVPMGELETVMVLLNFTPLDREGEAGGN
ncbi:MAG: rod shape-determining protein MreC [Chloroflexota bacterium]